MRAQALVLDDDRRPDDGGIQTVLSDTAPPGIEDNRIALRLAAFRDPDQFVDMLAPLQ